MCSLKATQRHDGPFMGAKVPILYSLWLHKIDFCLMAKIFDLQVIYHPWSIVFWPSINAFKKLIRTFGADLDGEPGLPRVKHSAGGCNPLMPPKAAPALL